MAIILSIESATTNCSVAVAVKGQVMASKELNSANFSHAENLHDFIEEVLQEAKLAMRDVQAISVSKGPGSYTGLRIGVSAAKGLAFGLQIPLISTSTLQALAMQVNIQEGCIVSMLDARRMEVYTQTYTKNYQPLNQVEAMVIEAASFDELLESHHQVHFLGSGAFKFAEICTHPNAVFYPDLVPSAKEQAVLAYTHFLNKEFENTAYFEPFYLKDFVGVKTKK